MGVEQYKIILDVPAEHPVLGFNEYSNALSQIISNSKPRFAVGIFGNWGTGKTTLMELIKRNLDNNCICVRFNAWRYEREEHLIVPLLDTMREALVNWDGNGNQESAAKAKSMAMTFGKVTKALLHGFSAKIGVPKALELTFDASKALSAYGNKKKAEEAAYIPRSFYHACFAALEKDVKDFVGNSNRRIVVFLDDLDRCLPEGTLSVLESMKLFFDFKGFIFVVGLDRRVVESSIDLRYQENHKSSKEDPNGQFQVRGEDYIKKIFQVPFTLSPVDATQLESYILSIEKNADLDNEQISDLKNNVRPHLEYLVTDEGLNPRQIKRFINAYTLQIKTESGNNNRDIILALHTIAFRQDWRKAYDALLFYGQIFIDGIKSFLDGNINALRDLELDIPQSFIRYVSPNEPGNDLLTISNLDYYIRRAESTRSESETNILPMIRKCASLRTLQRELLDQDRDVKEILDEMFEKILSLEKVKEMYPRSTLSSELARNSNELLARVKTAQGNLERFQ